MGNTLCKQDKRPPVNIFTKPTPAKTAAGTSYLIQVVYEHLPLAQQLDTQLVKRRWFREYGPALLAPIHTDTPKLLRLF